MEAGVDAATQKAKMLGITKPLGLGVTVLTSEEKKDNIAPLVLERALLAKQSGLDGVVASPWEAQMIRKELGKDFIIVTPGIRPPEGDKGDQKRVATASEAISQGSNFLVVGRPIVKAADVRKAAEEILKGISSVQSNS